MPSQSPFPRYVFSQVLGISALIAALVAVGCGSGSSYGGGGGGGGSPSLGAAVASQGSFSGGEQGAVYTITVSNTGTAATTGTVTVVDPPTGFTITAMSGMNWTCTLATTSCTNGSSVGAGQSFPPIAVTGNVIAAIGTPVSIPIGLSGGGASPVNVTPTPTVSVATVSACPLPTLGSENVLNGTFTVLFTGWNDSSVGPFQAAAAFVANGTGGVTSGEMDLGAVGVGVSSQSAPVLVTIDSGCYQLGSDLRGMMVWSLTGGRGPVTFAFTVRAEDGLGSLIEFDDANPSTTPGARGAGSIVKQIDAPFTLASLGAPWAFGLVGYSPNGSNSDYLRSGSVGRLDNSALGDITNGAVDVGFTKNGLGTQANVDNQAFTGALSAPDTLGRGTLTIAFANFNGQGPLTLNFAYYVMDSTDMWLQSIDTPDNNGHSLENGAMTTQFPGFGLGTLSGNTVFNLSGIDLSASHSFTVNAVGQMNSDGLGGVTVKIDEVSNGSVVASGTNTITGGSFAVLPNGMGALTFGTGGNAKWFSVAMDGPDDGFLLEGTQASPGANILTGNFRQQLAPPGGTFVDATFSGIHNFGSFRVGSSTKSTFQVGSATASTSTTPASLSGNANHSSGPGCNTNCLTANQPTTATYSVDPNGRIVITFGAGTGEGMAVGWLANKGRAGWLLSDTSDANETLLGILGTH
jgi:hypothetical protein